MELIPPERWNHVDGLNNPADCASRGLFPSELLNYSYGGMGLLASTQLNSVGWSNPTSLQPNDPSQEKDEICVHATPILTLPVILLNCFSNFTPLKRVTTPG